MHPVLALFRRNAWATRQLLEFCQGHPNATAAGAEGDVFGDIQAIFNHIVASDTGYLRLLTGELPEDRVRHGEDRPLRDLVGPGRWLDEHWLPALVRDRDPDLVLPYQRGDDREQMADWVPIVQCVHHGDDHRNQVATLLSRLGLEPPVLDGWAFLGQSGGGATAEIPTGARWPQLLARFIGHHLWANKLVLEHCRTLSPEQLSLSAPGTYGSIADTLDHLLTADRGYLSALGAGGWLEYLASDPDFDLLVRRGRNEAPAWAVVAQGIHHGNDHRTHLGTVLLHHHLEAPELDAWGYAFSEGALQLLD